MLERIKRALKRILRRRPTAVPVRWVRRAPDSWLAGWCAGPTLRPDSLPIFARIEALAERTAQHGPQPLWSGYKDDPRGPTRDPDAVRTERVMGALFAELAARRRPSVVVEFGTAFGVSGMYWLAGLEQAGVGRLYTFEPNTVWAGFAAGNLQAISPRFLLTHGTFESRAAEVLPEGPSIDIAFIDAIHTSEFVIPQLEIVLAHARPGALIVLDDINFSDDMRSCWDRVAQDPRFIASASLGDRVGIVELAS